ncbi:hypothetical protein JB92DRAFT_2778718, partial [Gautieria morchelliformis]
EGAVLEVRDRWPVCHEALRTLPQISTTRFLDATPQEDAAVTLRLLFIIRPARRHYMARD